MNITNDERNVNEYESDDSDCHRNDRDGGDDNGDLGDGDNMAVQEQA